MFMTPTSSGALWVEGTALISPLSINECDTSHITSAYELMCYAAL